MHIRRLQHTVFPVFLTGGALLALVAPFPAAIGGSLAIFWLCGMGWITGEALLPREHRGWQAFFGTLVFTAGTITLASLVYLAWRLDTLAVALTLVAASAGAARWAAHESRHHLPFGGFFAKLMESHSEVSHAKPAEKIFRSVLGILAVTAACWLLWAAALQLAGAATTESIRSPWDVAPPQVFALVFIAAALAFTAAYGGLAPRLSLFATGALMTLFASAATLTYKVGFGFDPFLHRVTETAIFQYGLIEPKPFYYVGQYALVTITAKFLHGSVVAVDTALVPVMLALLVPCAYYAMRRGFGFFRPVAAAGTFGLLLLPLSSFAATTPQGFANAVFLMTAFLAIPAALGRFPLRALLALAAFCAAIHPLAGVPLGAFILLLISFRASDTPGVPALMRHRATPWIIAVAGAVALPALFLLNSLLSGAAASVDTDAVRSGANALLAGATAAPTRRYDLFLDLVYSWKFVRSLAWFAAAAVGLMSLRGRTHAWKAWIVGAGMFATNWVLMKSAVHLPFLISYEQSSYADRVAELTLFLLAPLALLAAGAALQRLREGFPLLRVGATALLAALATSSFYLAYPRNDQYEPSRGWSVSAADVATVRSINEDAAGKPYVVLANQAVSAAAVNELGFRTYYDSHDPSAPGPVFFYPIPTGGPLYAVFLKANSELGRRASVARAMDLAGVDTVYYVVNHYWWDARRITVVAKKEADRNWTVDGKNFVFKYSRK